MGWFKEQLLLRWASEAFLKASNACEDCDEWATPPEAMVKASRALLWQAQNLAEQIELMQHAIEPSILDDFFASNDCLLDRPCPQRDSVHLPPESGSHGQHCRHSDVGLENLSRRSKIRSSSEMEQRRHELVNNLA
jgi:hypothetical protein